MESKAPKARMQERGYKALTTFVKEVTYHALRRYTQDVGISHSKYLCRLAEEDLKKKGYLRISFPDEVPRKSKPKAT